MAYIERPKLGLSLGPESRELASSDTCQDANAAATSNRENEASHSILKCA